MFLKNFFLNNKLIKSNLIYNTKSLIVWEKKQSNALYYLFFIYACVSEKQGLVSCCSMSIMKTWKLIGFFTLNVL